MTLPSPKFKIGDIVIKQENPDFFVQYEIEAAFYNGVWKYWLKGKASATEESELLTIHLEPYK